MFLPSSFSNPSGQALEETNERSQSRGCAVLEAQLLLTRALAALTGKVREAGGDLFVKYHQFLSRKCDPGIKTEKHWLRHSPSKRDE